MRNVEKILCFIILLFILLGCLNCVYATSYVSGSGSGVGADSVITAMKDLDNPSDIKSIGEDSKISDIVNTVIGFIQIVGTGISVIMVSVLGIKYILASPGDKAEVKKQITPMLIGAFILFASVNIIQVVADFAADL